MSDTRKSAENKNVTKYHSRSRVTEIIFQLVRKIILTITGGQNGIIIIINTHNSASN